MDRIHTSTGHRCSRHHCPQPTLSRPIARDSDILPVMFSSSSSSSCSSTSFSSSPSASVNAMRKSFTGKINYLTLLLTVFVAFTAASSSSLEIHGQVGAEASDAVASRKADHLISQGIAITGKILRETVESRSNRSDASADSEDEGYDDYAETTEPPLVDAEQSHQNLTDDEMASRRAHEAWLDISRWTRRVTDDILRESLPPIMELTYDMDVNPACTSSILKIVSGYREQRPWAVKFLDSMFRPTSGFFDGTITDFGDFDQCLSIDDADNAIKGQYCLMIVRPTMPNPPRRVSWKSQLFNFTGTEIEGTALEELSKSIAGIYQVPGRLGVCVPHTCSVKDMQEMARLFTTHSSIQVEAPRECQLKRDPMRISTYQAVSICGLLILTTLVVIGTLMDVRHRNSNNKKRNVDAKGLEAILLTFSAKTNCEKLFRIEYNPANLPALHGMRFFTIFWAVIVHTYGFGSFSPWLYRNLIDLTRRVESPPYQLLSNAFVLVDTFFMIGGLTLVYVTLPLMEKRGGRLNIPLYILHRWLRMTPTVTGAIFLNSLLPFFWSSPYEPDIDFIYKSCETNWWANYLFIQNWFSGSDMCLIQAWYISADTQLYLLALAILIPLYWRPKLAMGLIAGSCVVACFVSGLIVYLKDLPGTVMWRYMSSFESIDKFCQITYYPTYEHLSPYFIGMLAGYIIYKHRSLAIHNGYIALGWLASFAALIGVLFIPLPWARGADPPAEIAGLYAGLHRSVWAIGVAWVVFACVTGRGGYVNSILTARFMVPVSRLGFGMYLLQIPLIAIRITNKARDTQIWTDLEMISQSMSNFMWTFLLAFGLYVLCEAPFAALEKLLMQRLGVMGRPHQEARPHLPPTGTSTGGANTQNVHSDTPKSSSSQVANMQASAFSCVPMGTVAAFQDQVFIQNRKRSRTKSSPRDEEGARSNCNGSCCKCRCRSGHRSSRPRSSHHSIETIPHATPPSTCHINESFSVKM